MIDSEAIERAEQVLQVVYRDPNYERQLEAYEVQREAFDNWLEARKEGVRKHYNDAWASMDPVLEPALNTLFMHIFLTGIICGKNIQRGLS